MYTIINDDNIVIFSNTVISYHFCDTTQLYYKLLSRPGQLIELIDNHDY